MGFFKGRVGFLRFGVRGRSPKMFGPEHLEKLSEHAIGKHRQVSADGVQVGWTAGDHILDTQFELAKNIVNDTLQFELRVDSQKVPAELLRAYTQVELQGLAAGNPSGIPSARQKRDARASARERLEKEAEDGRFLRSKAYPILWDGQTREVLVGTSALTVIDRLHTIFQQTFGHGFELIGAGQRAFLLAELHEQTRRVDDAKPASFVAGASAGELAWIPDEASRDFLGNEFLLWLWHVLDAETDTIGLADGSEVAIMMARNLVLECPRGQTGKESITSDAPTRLPEARRAIQAGKLPRKAGLTLVRQDRQYELSIQAETLGVNSAKLPTPDAEDERARLEERVTLLRHLVETLDLLYDNFGQLRMSESWPRELAKIKKWLQHDERERATA
jgi:hypothetical protein